MQTPVSSIEPQVAPAGPTRQDQASPSDASAAAAPGAAASRRIYIRPRRGWRAVDFKELWLARELVWQFTLRDIQVRYKQTFFGYAWALVVPVLQVLIFTVFFGNVLGIGEKVNEAAGRALPYALFALTGQVVWNLFKSTIDGASHSLIANANIVRKVYIPRLALPLSALGKPVVDASVVFVLMLVLAWWYSADPSYDLRLTPRIALAPLLLAGGAIPALAVGLIAAAITVHYRDLQYVLPFFTSLLFYVTPVIYSVELLPERFAWLIYLNPIAGFVQAHRAVVMDLPVDWMGLGLSLGFSVVLLVFGLFFFTRAERRFADVA